MIDDAELLRRYAETRSESAFAELVQRHLDLVYAAALRRLNGDTRSAADVTQHVFLALARHAAPLSRRPILASWLHTATRHAAIDLLRQETRRASREQHAHALETVNAPTTPVTDWEKLRPVLDEAIDELPERDRDIVLLRFFENQSFAALGAKLSVNEDAARMRANRALEKLRELLARRGITSTAAALGATLAAQPTLAAPTGLAATVTTACATSVTSTLTSAFTFTLMTTKTILGVAGVLIAVSIGATIHYVRLAERSNLAFVDLQRGYDRLEAQNIALTTRLATTISAPPAGTSKAPVTPGLLRLSPATSLWADPAYAVNYVARNKAGWGLNYGQLYRDLNLSAEQIEKFEAAKTEFTQNVAESWTVSAANGLSINDSAVTRLTTEPFNIQRSRLVAVLGDAGFARYVQYDNDKPFRAFVASFAGEIYYSDNPLSAARGASLTEIVKAQTETKKIPLKDEGPNTIYTLTKETNWAEVIAQARSLLSANQLVTLEHLADRQRTDAQFNQQSNQPKK